ncbi:hypothetical protein bcgnr5372_37980 [Bacillus luti]|nr:hypothetical protein [Bacillus cereus]HDR8329486.1 hypothetical protein [Bacillus cereus]HDR8337572.1 hypothetical protein [Bacillus cereus]
MENTNQLAILINEKDETKDEARTIIDPSSQLRKMDEIDEKIDPLVDTIIANDVQKYLGSIITHKDVLEVMRKGVGKLLADGCDLEKVSFGLLDESTYVDQHVLLGESKTGINAFDVAYRYLNIDQKRLLLKREYVDNDSNHFASSNMELFLVIDTEL